MRFDITNVTRFEYEGPVIESNNELRACPANRGRQTLLHYRVTTDPGTDVESHVDWFGTQVDTFGIRPHHEHLEIRAEATVDVVPAKSPMSDVSLDALADQAFRDHYGEWLAPSRLVAWTGELADWCRDVAPDSGGVVELVRGLVAAGGARLEHERGSTSPTTTAAEAFAAGRGVSQDVVHVTLAALRSRGVPARYVSGYHFQGDGGDVLAAAVQAETHAWLEVAVPGFGWWSLDPSAGVDVVDRHIRIGAGRDYADVPPLRGTYVGPPGEPPSVRVDMRMVAQVQQQQQ